MVGGKSPLNSDMSRPNAANVKNKKNQQILNQHLLNSDNSQARADGGVTVAINRFTPRMILDKDKDEQVDPYQ